MSNKAAQTVEHGDYVRKPKEEYRVIRGLTMNCAQHVRTSQILEWHNVCGDLFPEMICPHISSEGACLKPDLG
jgi:hypothetical protein